MIKYEFANDGNFITQTNHKLVCTEILETFLLSSTMDNQLDFLNNVDLISIFESLTITLGSVTDPNNSWTSVVIDRDYKGVIKELRRGGKIEANKSFDFTAVCMTGLEWAIYKNDLKMAALFFSFGADPKNNAFDGILQTQASYGGYESPIVFSGFDGNKVPGFDGLNLIVDEHEDRVKAYVWLMKALYHDGTISIHKNLCGFINNIDIISEDLHFSGDDCKDLVRNTLLCMRRIGMPNDVAIRIVEETVLGTLWVLVQRHGLRGCEEEV